MAFHQLLLLIGLASIVQCDFVGKFIFHGSKQNNDQQASLSIYYKPDSINFAPSPNPLPANEISSVLSLSLGFSIPKDIKWNGLYAGSLFERPKAVLMVSIDNLPKGHSLKRKVATSIPVSMTDDVTSVEDVYLMSSSLSLPSHVNGIMNGHSTTVSISLDENVAGAGFSRGEETTTSFWNDMTDSWRSIGGNGKKKDSLDKHSIYKRIASLLPKGFQHNFEEKKVEVNMKNLQVSFDLKNRNDFNLFSELVFMKWQCQEIESKKKLVKDGTPDVYLFSIASLKGIEKQYGENSKQMKAALHLLEEVVPEIVASFRGLYKGDILAVGLNLQSQSSIVEPHHNDLQKVLTSLKDQFGQELKHVVPELHATKTLEQKAHKNLCHAVQGAIARFAPNLKFKCNDENGIHKVFRRSLMEAPTATKDLNLASDYDDMFPVIFNIWFWLIVILALATYAISLVMWNMDPGRDSIIYRLTQQKIKGE